MNIEQNMDPELRAVFVHMPQLLPDDTGDIVGYLRNSGAELKALRAGQPVNDRVTVEDRSVPGLAGAPDVPVRIYMPRNRTDILPGLLYIHGGGFIMGDIEADDPHCSRIAEDIGCVVVSVGYRLAPEYPFPAGLEDCYAALLWMASSAGELGIDTARMAVAGGSAGGGLAAAVALMARDRKEVKLVFQQLLCACLDDRHLTPSSHAFTDGRTWNRQASLGVWKAYLGGAPADEVSPYAAPARMKNLSGLPPAYIMVGELELLRDENIEYAMRLMQAGVPTELHVYPGAFHGFEKFVPTAAISVRATKEYDEALRRALNR